MSLDKAKCPHCESLIEGSELAKLEVDTGGIAPMGAGKKQKVLYVCPSCNMILG